MSNAANKMRARNTETVNELNTRYHELSPNSYMAAGLGLIIGGLSIVGYDLILDSADITNDTTGAIYGFLAASFGAVMMAGSAVKVMIIDSRSL
jgi:hypothetical protein